MILRMWANRLVLAFLLACPGLARAQFVEPDALLILDFLYAPVFVDVDDPITGLTLTSAGGRFDPADPRIRTPGLGESFPTPDPSVDWQVLQYDERTFAVGGTGEIYDPASNDSGWIGFENINRAAVLDLRFGDLNEDVWLNDLTLTLLTADGRTITPVTQVTTILPEPTSAAVLLGGAVVALTRRRTARQLAR